jgi:hypothetical protein
VVTARVKKPGRIAARAAGARCWGTKDLFLAEKTNGQFKKSQLPSQLRLQFGSTEVDFLV